MRIFYNTVRPVKVFIKFLSILLIPLAVFSVAIASPVTAAPNITISSRTPGVNARNVSVSSDISVTFSENINSGTVNASTFNVDGSISGKIAGTYQTDGSTVSFNLTDDFRPGEIVYVTLTTGIHDSTDGDSLAKPVTWQFTVQTGGSGTFSGNALIGTDSHTFGTSVAVADFNRDGYLDIAIGNSYDAGQGEGQNKVFFNDGDGTFDSAGYNLGPGTDDTWGLAAGDVDGDGDMDIAVANTNGVNVVYYNNGSGSFGTSDGFGTSDEDSYGVSMGDMNGDGWLDIVVTNYTKSHAVYLNDGDGTFDTAGITFASSSTWVPATLGDFDNDGDLDAVITVWNGQAFICFNNGSGTLSSGTAFGPSDPGCHPVNGDADGDGDLDLVVANSSQVNRVYANNGSGVFSELDTFGDTASSRYCVDLNDVDGDGDLDAVDGIMSSIKIYKNPGTGIFGSADSTIPNSSDSIYDMALADVNSDGGLDVVVAGNNDKNMVFYSAVTEMSVEGNGTTIIDGDSSPSLTDHTDFGSTNITGGTVVRTFTIKNTGTAPLNLTGAPRVVIGGDHFADFVVTADPGTPVAAAGSTTFQVTFNPSTDGLRNATVSIANNDSNENPYNFSICGTGVAPEMSVEGNGTAITDGDSSPSLTDHTDFGNANVTGGTVVRTFTIKNTGTTALNLTGAPRVVIGGDHSADFVVIADPSTPVAATSGSTTFQVTFNPGADGLRNATISIANDDSDENPYNFSICGTGISLPEINVKQDGTDIADGGTYDFGNKLVGSTTDTIFPVENTGGADLNLTGDPKVAISGDTAAFSITAQPASPVAAADNTTFMVRFAPVTTGLKTAEISIASNDSDENPYNITLNGTGTVAPAITNLNGDTVTFYEGTEVVLDLGGNASVSDADATGYNGGNVTVAISGGGAASEDLSIRTGSGVSLSTGMTVGSIVTVDPTVIGTIGTSGQDGANLVINLNASATDALLSTLLRNINYNNDSQDPSGSRTVNFTVTDSAYTSDVSAVTVNITGINDAPMLTATGLNPTYVEVMPKQDLFSTVLISAVESGQNIDELKITVTNVNDRSSEYLFIDGYYAGLSDGYTFTTTNNNMTASIIIIGSTATVTVSKTGGVSAATMQLIVDELAYINSSTNPSTNNRVVTLTSIRDTGSTANGGVDSTTLSITSTVTVVAVNNRPDIVNLNGDSISILAAGSSDFIDNGGDARVRDVDSPDFNGGNLTIIQTSGTANGNFSFDGINVTSGIDGVITAGETVEVPGAAVGNIDAVNDGQGGNNLVINFSLDATPARAATIIANLKYFAPSGLGARPFNLTIKDGDGTANGGNDTSTTSVFTVNVTPNPPVITNLDGDSIDYNIVTGGQMVLDVGANATVTDPDSSNFNGGNVTVTIAGGGTPAEDKLGISIAGTISLSAGVTNGSTVSAGGVNIGTITSNGAGGNDLVVTFNGSATLARVSTLIQAITYENTNNVNPSNVTRNIEITVTDAGATAATSNVSVVMVDMLLPEMNLKQGVTGIADGGLFDFGDQVVNTSNNVIFTIENSGTANLNITTPLTIGGADAGQFSIQTQPASPVTASGNTTFVIRFLPTSTGLKTANIAIDNNDGNENPYNLDIQGTGIRVLTAQVDSTTGSGIITVTTGAGSIQGLVAVDPNSLPAAGRPPDTIFPHGMVGFNIIGINPGDVVIMTLTYPSNIPVGTQYWQCQNNDWIDCTGLLGDDDGDNILTLTLTDGGPGDGDGAANGVIMDPGGLGLPAPATSLATASESLLTQNDSFAEPPVMRPALVSLSHLTISPPQASVGQPVTISFNVINDGDEPGNYNVNLVINGHVEQKVAAVIAPQSSEQVKCQVVKSQPGAYAINIGGQKGSFQVNGSSNSNKAEEPSDARSVAAVIFSIMIVIAGALIVLFLRRFASPKD